MLILSSPPCTTMDSMQLPSSLSHPRIVCRRVPAQSARPLHVCSVSGHCLSKVYCSICLCTRSIIVLTKCVFRLKSSSGLGWLCGHACQGSCSRGCTSYGVGRKHVSVQATCFQDLVDPSGNCRRLNVRSSSDGQNWTVEVLDTSVTGDFNSEGGWIDYQYGCGHLAYEAC